MANLLPVTAHYVILESSIVLDAHQYDSWKDIQAAYPTYVSSLGPWKKLELIRYLQDDFGAEANWPISRDYIDTIFGK